MVLISTLLATGCQQMDGDLNVTAEEFLSLSDTTNHVILDVRTSREYEAGHLDQALLIDIHADDFTQTINSLDQEQTYYVYCQSGYRSISAVRKMRKKGFSKAYNIRGGIRQLKRNGVNLVK
jgi:rhodanese-related sulfurtransferase